MSDLDEDGVKPWASLRIFGPDRDGGDKNGVPNIDEVTNLIGTTPTHVHRVGEPMIYPWYKPGVATGKWTSSMWSLSSQEAVASSSLIDHVEWIVRKIEAVGSALGPYLERKHLNGDIYCSWPVIPGEGLILDPCLLRGLAELGLQISLSIPYA